MADVTVEGSILATAPDTSCQQLVAIDGNTLYAFFVSSADNDVYYRKSTNGGASWAAAVLIEAGSHLAVTVWYDRWTPGNTGTLIHIIYQESGASNNVKYDSLDTSNDTLSGEKDVASITHIDSTGAVNSITRTKGGNLLVAMADDLAAGVVYKSTTVGASASFSSVATCMETTAKDFVKLFPANLADPNDAWALFEDVSVTELLLKTYDDSANSWAEVLIDAAVIDQTAANGGYTSFAGSIRHSDGHLLVAAWNDRDTATADFQFWDITDAGTITAKTNLVTNSDDMYGAAVYIDNTTNEIYVFNLGAAGGGDALNATVGVHFYFSSDGGATWSGQQAYSEGTDDDYRNLWCDLGNQSGASGRVGCLWWDDDDNDYWYNHVLSRSIPAMIHGRPDGQFGQNLFRNLLAT